MCPWPEWCPMLTDEIMIKTPLKEKSLWIIVGHTEKQICKNKNHFQSIIKIWKITQKYAFTILIQENII